MPRHEARAVFHPFYNRIIEGVSVPVYFFGHSVEYRVVGRGDRDFPIIALQKDYANVIVSSEGNGQDLETYFVGDDIFKDMEQSGELIEISREISADSNGYYLREDGLGRKRYFRNEYSALESGFALIDNTLTHFKYLPANLCAIKVLSIRPEFRQGGSLYRNLMKRVKVVTIEEQEQNYTLLNWRVSDNLYNGFKIPIAIQRGDLHEMINGGFLVEDYFGQFIPHYMARLVHCGHSNLVHYFPIDWLENESSIDINNTFTEINLVYYGDDIYLNPAIAGDYNIYYCSECDEFFDEENDDHSHDSGYDDDDDRSDYNPRFGYHSQTHADKSKQSKFKVGFEIEKECSEGCQHDHHAIYSASNWVKERDGSLDDETGYELVSSTYNLFNDDLLNQAKALEAQFPKLINGRTTKNCGGHIHFSKGETLGADLLESICGYLPVLYSIYQHRIGKSYCEVKEKEQMKNSEEKYQAVRVMRGRIEFRIFPAVKNLSTLEWRLGLIRIMAKNSSNDPVSIINKLTDSRTELHKHFAKIFSKSVIMQKANKALEYAKKFDRNYYNIDLRINANKIKAKENKAIREESGKTKRQLITA